MAGSLASSIRANAAALARAQAARPTPLQAEAVRSLTVERSALIAKALDRRDAGALAVVPRAELLAATRSERAHEQLASTAALAMIRRARG